MRKAKAAGLFLEAASRWPRCSGHPEPHSPSALRSPGFQADLWSVCAPQLSVLEKLSQNLCPKTHSGWLFHTSVLRDHPFLFSSTHSWFNLSSRGSCHRGALPIAARCAALNAGVESEEML